MAMTCRAAVEAQLVKGIKTAGEDCGVRTFMRAIRWASCGKVRFTVAESREMMNKPSGPANVIDWYRAMEHPKVAAAFKKVGLHPPVAKLRGTNAETGIIHGSPVKTAIDALEDGDMVCAAEGYAPWHGTKFAGSETFGTGERDNHAVSYLGLRGVLGRRRTTRYDSLDDNRRPGIPHGPLTVPFHLASEAMGDLTFRSGRKLGNGLWGGMVVERAKPLVQDPPPPPPADECDELRDGLGAAAQAIADLRARFDALDEDAKDALDDAGAALDAITKLLGEHEDVDPDAVVLPGTDAGE